MKSCHNLIVSTETLRENKGKGGEMYSCKHGLNHEKAEAEKWLEPLDRISASFPVGGHHGFVALWIK